MEKTKMTCVVCPLGCEVTVTTDDGKITDITGHSCKRGDKYARTEMTDPRRTLTTTIRVAGGTRPTVAVKSSEPIQKPRLIECMRAMDTIAADAPICIGDVLISDILGTGIDIVATDDVAALA